MYGRDITIHLDHKPLVAILKKPMHKVSPRLRRLAFRLYIYSFVLEYTLGSKMVIADTLSRSCSMSGEKTTTHEETLKIHEILHTPVTNKLLSEIMNETQNDVQYN